MKVIMRCGDIPIGSIVKKITGTKEYELRDHIRIFHEGSSQDINVDDNTLFLVAKTMGFTISAISKDTEMLWEVSEEDLYEYLQHRRVERIPYA